MNGIRALVFDVFGTLVDWRGGMITHLSSWGDARGIRADWPTLVDAWRMDYPPSLDRVRRGERAWVLRAVAKSASGAASFWGRRAA